MKLTRADLCQLLPATTMVQSMNFYGIINAKIFHVFNYSFISTLFTQSPLTEQKQDRAIPGVKDVPDPMGADSKTGFSSFS